MNKLQTIRLGIGDDITARITEHLKQAVLKSSALEFAPAVFVSGVERRARAIEGMVGASFLRGTPELISRELLTQFMPQLYMRNSVERDFDIFGALTATLQTLGENRHSSRALVEQLIEARKRLAENYAPVDRNNDALRKLGSRGELLSGVLELYSQRLKHTNTFDQEDAPWLAAANMSDWKSFAPKLLVIEELTQVRPARKRFLHALMQQAEKTILIIREGLAFTQNATSELLDNLEVGKLTLEPASLPFGKPAIVLLADSVTPTELPENLILRRSFSRFSEVRDTAQEIKLAVKAGCQPQDIAVVAPSLGKYETLIEETFRAAGIPFDSAYAAPIDLLPPVTPILDLVRCARNGLDRIELIDAMSSPYLRFDAEDEQARLKRLDQFEAATREANIVGGRSLKKDWMDKLDGQKAEGKQLKKRVDAVLKLLLPFTKPQIGAATFMSEVSKLLEASCAADVLALESGDENSATRNEALHEFRKLLRDMAAEFKLAGDPKLRCSEILQALLEQCRTREVRRPEQHADRVQIFGLRELQLSSFKQVFVLGLTDLDLPLSESDSMFFPSVREVLVKEVFGEIGKNLHTPIDVARQADYLYVHALLAAREKLVLSMPQSDGDTPMVPAVIHARMMSLFGQSKVEDISAAPESCPISEVELASEVAALLEEGTDSGVQMGLTQALRKGVHGRLVDLSRYDESAKPGEYGGQVAAFEELTNKFGLSGNDRHTYSPSQIDLYAACPMRFWFRYVLGLRKEDDPTLEPPASEIGTFVHNVFERFIWLLREHNGQPDTVEDPKDRVAVNLLEVAGNREAAEELGTALLREAFKQIAKETYTEGPYWSGTLQCLESGLAGGTANRLGRGALSAFLTEELDRCEQGISCRFVEFTFGKEKPDDACRDQVLEKLELTLPQGSIILQGSVDRVDESDDGLEIVDYKTGQAKTRGEIENGKAFQLPTYLAAISAKVGTKPAGLSYLKVPLFKPLERPDIVRRGQNNELGIANLVEHELPQRLQKMLSAIGGGIFIHTPFTSTTDACRYCEFSTACAKDESLIEERQGKMHELVPEAYVSGPVETAETAEAE
ncbi:MAG: PD-(D/E)XK nuclease family protein [Planctomycetota bacterium]